MSISTFSLPLDIPWKRVCVSGDMTDGSLCDAHMPPRWRSSIAIFSYQPPEEDQTYDDMLVSYYKVTCSITGYQYQARDRKEVGIERRRGSYWTKGKVADDYDAEIYKYYACHGALLEVSVGGSRATEGIDTTVGIIRLDQNHGPYFADFEPKKREVYELVTETGEIMSRSLESTNVRKGKTTTDTNEVLDNINLSANFSQTSGVKQAQQPETTIGAGVEVGSKSRDLSQQEITNLRTTDQGREMRETYSHSTQLTQMYHQLTSYHVGTNRAMFVLLPRPHIVQPKDENGDPIYTFVNGPRELEGIQEFFFAVMRPKALENVCIEAYLETAHIGRIPILEPKGKDEKEFHFQKLEARARDTSPTVDLEGANNSNKFPKVFTDHYEAPTGWVIDIDNADNPGGFRIDSAPSSGEDSKILNITVSENLLSITCQAVGEFIDRPWPERNVLIHGSIEVFLTIFIRTVELETANYTDKLFLTGRGLCCCPGANDYLSKARNLMSESVTFEKTLPRMTSDIYKVRGAKNAERKGMTIHEANLMRNEVGKEMMASMNSPDRYPRGLIQLPETQLVSDTIALSLIDKDHPDNQNVLSIPGMDPELAKRLAEAAPRLKRIHLLRMSLQELVDRFDLNHDDVVRVRRAALGLEGPFGDPARRWSRGPENIVSTVPDVLGLTKEEATLALSREGLGVGSVEFRDTGETCSFVVEQQPGPGDNAERAVKVDLVISTGASVRVPAVIGANLSDALVALRDAGLRSQPEIILTDKYTQEQRITNIEPRPNQRITPSTRVVLTVGLPQEGCK